MSDEVPLREYVEVRLKCVGDLIAANDKALHLTIEKAEVRMTAIADKVNDLRVQAGVVAALISIAVSLLAAWIKR